jgi:predicted ester cyclase
VERIDVAALDHALGGRESVSEANKALVREYFTALDSRVPGAATAMFAPDAVIHRSDAPEPILGREGMKRFSDRNRPVYGSFRTSIDDLIAEGDKVVARIRHFVTFESDWQSPIGPVAAAGREGWWGATAIFQIRDGQIIEEWVARDDLGLLQELGALRRPS